MAKSRIMAGVLLAASAVFAPVQAHAHAHAQDHADRSASSAVAKGAVEAEVGSGEATARTVLIAQASLPSFPEGHREIVPLLDAIETARARYAGTIIEADVVPPRPEEFAEIIYELRLLTEAGNVLRIRMDAVTGAFIDVEGRGLVEARKPPGASVSAEDD